MERVLAERGLYECRRCEKVVGFRSSLRRSAVIVCSEVTVRECRERNSLSISGVEMPSMERIESVGLKITPEELRRMMCT